MNKKKIVVLSAVIIVLLCALAGVMMMDSSDVPVRDEGVGSDSAENTYEKSYDENGDIYRCSIDSITDITVGLYDESFTFTKSGDVWECKSLPEGSLNTAKVSTLATKLGALRYVEAFESGVSAADCGITEDTPSVTFTSDKGEITLRIAESFNDDNLCYVSASVSEVIYSVRKTAVETFTDSLESYRNDSLVRVNREDAEEIRISNENGLIVLKKGEADRANAVFNEWRMSAPLEISASDPDIDKIVFEAFQNMKIAQFVADDANYSVYGLGAKDKYISVTESGGKVKTLYFGNKKDGMYYVCTDASESIYGVEEAMLPFASLKPIDFADRHVKLVMKDALSKIEVYSSEAKYNIEVSQTRDESKINGKKLVESDFSGKVFSSVCGLIADDICTDGAGSADVVITYTYTDGTADKIEFMQYNERYYSVSENGSSKFLIQKSKMDSMLETLSQFK